MKVTPLTAGRALETGRPRKERFADYQKRRQEHHAEMEHVETQDRTGKPWEAGTEETLTQ